MSLTCRLRHDIIFTMKNIFLLDLDDTLLDFLRAERVNLKRALAEFGIFADEKKLARFHEINDALWKALERGETTRERILVERFEIFLRECGYPADARAVAENYFSGFPDICFPFDGAVGFLQKLAARGRVYIVTNGSKNIQIRHIEDAGFAPFLSGSFISQDIGVNKPDLRFADYVEAHIDDYARERAVWMGDSITSDKLCAERRGIDFVLYAPRGIPAGYKGAVAENYEQALKLLLNK